MLRTLSQGFRLAGVLVLGFSLSCASDPASDPEQEITETSVLINQEAALDGEVHLVNVRQLTFGGENAEAYFSSDGSRLIFQSTREGVPCDQIFTMNLDGSDLQMVSTGDGRTTCGYFSPGDDAIVYASTHLGDQE